MSRKEPDIPFEFVDPAITAIVDNDMKGFQRICEEDPTVIHHKFRSEQGATLLHIAAFHGKKEFVEYLIDKGAEIDSLDQYKQNPLYYAAQNGHNDLANFLIEKGSKYVKEIYGKSHTHVTVSDQLINEDLTRKIQEHHLALEVMPVSKDASKAKRFKSAGMKVRIINTFKNTAKDSKSVTKEGMPPKITEAPARKAAAGTSLVGRGSDSSDSLESDVGLESNLGTRDETIKTPTRIMFNAVEEWDKPAKPAKKYSKKSLSSSMRSSFGSSVETLYQKPTASTSSSKPPAKTKPKGFVERLI